MEDKIIEEAREGRNAADRQNRLREGLHHLILQEADRKEAFRDICFVGGTALRLLYGLERYSEDLDFSLSSQATSSFDFGKLVRRVEKSLQTFGFKCLLAKPKTRGAVHSIFFTFEGLLYQVDRQFRAGQKLAIKFEVDTKPPRGGEETLSPITVQRLYKVRHYDLPSLFAGKLHALLFRTYTKGRDLFDFLWYVGRQVPVNGLLLQNAIAQTEGRSLVMANKTLQKLLAERFKKVDFEAAKKDVAPFLSDPASLDLFDPTVFMNSVSKVILRGEQKTNEIF